jgi:oligoendopeptidase F
MSAIEAADVTWDLDPLLQGREVDDLLAEAGRRADALAGKKGQVASFSGADLVAFMTELEEARELMGRAGGFASLQYAADTSDPANGALMQHVQELSTAIATKLLFFNLEFAALDDDAAAALLTADGIERFGHHLESIRRYRPHMLSEAEERVLTEKAITGRSAWVRLFGELTSSITVEIDGSTLPLEEGLSQLGSPDGEVRKKAAAAVTAGLAPGLRTRAYLFNTLLHDKAVDDRLRGYDHWLASWNLGQEASDESVEALVSSVKKRYDIPQRWYALKARIWGVDRIADYDRNASLATSETTIPFAEAKEIVLDCYNSFSTELGDLARRFFDERWIDAPVRPGKRPGAFCSYTVPSHHPYVFLNYTARPSDVTTMAHELGHGVHGALARKQGYFHQATPLTVAETASVFGETVTFNRLLEMTTDPAARLALLADNIEGAIATVFRQTAMNQFESLVHNARRDEGELSVERFGELWEQSQAEMLGPSVEITEGYKSWWSYIPHFIGTPGYVYAYAYGQLLALSVYHQYEEQGSDFVPRYLNMLASGGSLAPEELGRIVGCDLEDHGFWDGGLALVEEQLEAAETAAWEAGRLTA